MHLPKASWLLAACMGTMINASQILEVDLVFPRNETYAPTDWFPLVFAFQNASSAQYLNPSVEFTLWNLQDDNDALTGDHDLRGHNWTAENTYLAYSYYSRFKKEGHYRVVWTVTWESCDKSAYEKGPTTGMIHNMTTWSTWFTIQESAQKVDLVAATANKSCPEEFGVVIDVTDKTMKVPWNVKWSGGDYTNDTCAVVAANSTATHLPDPCRVQIDKTTVESMEASLLARLCAGLNPPSNCPEDKKNAGQQLAVVGISCLIATFGALGFFFV
ncbi:hypothetical protein N7457_006294 [Penicillium paradoxum]|uniref:uncharacterized protein n=1 Tax=Penicillium paradoxum TaxID=176176 RepID=UPI0025488A12|nr:uncharacterized protein N7457_006294 [Penicillium paradoxum]KAJ5781134.1 hypothetical protein N7457_006294 [Penicillium paradoxum]